MLANLTREVIHVHLVINKKNVSHDVYEGEVRMSGQQQDVYKQLIGDGLGKITVSQELSESDYGNGGKVMVAITVICDQSQPGLSSAIDWANSLVAIKSQEHMEVLKQQLLARGILKP